MTTEVQRDQKNIIKNDRTLNVGGQQFTQIDRGRQTQITTGNEVKNVLAGSSAETISLLKSVIAKQIFHYGQEEIKLEVGKQTSLIMDNEKLLLRFAQNSILIDAEGIWLNGIRIGLQEKEVQYQNIQPSENEHIRFKLQDDKTNYAINKREFAILTKNNRLITGNTNDKGETQKLVENELFESQTYFFPQMEISITENEK
ncbi:hypothetical protein A6A20_00420 [Volucribacter amazonae]|uniref:Uncharacterized protein n=2 Tax=Volucribacter amazonae TaxID=256731 RepID=A0A9X4PAK3_9PAST|nr:hypothetical protein [Volucribacter amazonae]MDG6894129.1 hypothetical protein [Volucribacter amazonae]